MSKAVFFRQSAWMMFANLASGVFMFAVHFFSKKIPEPEYAILGTLLAVLNCMTIPTLSLQMVFTHQTASAVSDSQHRQLVATIRAVVLGTLLIWLAMAVGVWFEQRELMAMWKIANPLPLWVTVFVALGGLCSPVFFGLMQGRQSFFWLGWAIILNGVVRLSCVTVIVFSLNAFASGSLILPGFVLNVLQFDRLGVYAGGILFAAVLGMLVAVAIAVWQSRSVWRGRAEKFDWRRWLSHVAPLTFGFGASQLLFSADPLFVQKYFDKEMTHSYIAVGTMCRALVVFVAPMAAVMFPKIVHSRARSEKSDLMKVALVITAALVGFGALCLTVMAPWIIRLVFKESFVAVGVPLMKWFAWAMVPLALANVLLNNLLAHSAFRVVPWLVAVAAGYVVTLMNFHNSFVTVIQVIGGFNVLFLAVTVWFTWVQPPQDKIVAEVELPTTSPV